MAIPKDLNIRQLHEGLLSKKFKAFEITEDYFKRIDERDKEVRAYLHLMKDDALKTAAEVDEMLASGKDIPLLAGVPVALKDNMLVKGHPATAGSKILERYTASYDAHVTEKLKSQKAMLLGKTNLDEFGMGSSTENSAFHPTRNPHDLSKVPGGSSGGSAAAVAGEMALAALGSDTGGSIREPAAFCGVVGLKPTYGTVSRSGLIALASSLDQIGPFTRTVEDAAIMFHAIAGHDPMDATSVPPAHRDHYGSELLKPDFAEIKNLRIGIPEEYFAEGIAPEVQKALQETIENFKRMGFSFKKVSLPHTKYALSTYYVILPAEASSNLARFDGIRYGRHPELAQNYFAERGYGFGAEPKRRIILGTFVLSAGYYDAYYKKAQEVRALVSRDFKKAFEEVDVLFAPVTPTTAFPIGEKANDPLAMYLCDVFTIPVNLAGIPGISIPAKNVQGMPIGFQLIGKPYREADILGLGQLYERQ